MANETRPHGQIDLAFDRGTLLLTEVGREMLPDISGPSVWAWDSRVGALRCDAIHYAAVRPALAAQPSAVARAQRPEPVASPEVSVPPISRLTQPVKPAVQHPYIATELLTIGILAGIMLTILVVLASVLA